LVAQKLKKNPELLDIACKNLIKIRDELSSESISVMEWGIVLKFNIEKICEFITQNNEHLNELRQSSPFSGILTEEERRCIREKIFARTPHSGNEFS
jgi:hypothetical protein